MTGGGMIMKTFVMVLFLLILLLLNTPMAIAQFSEAGVEHFKVAVNAPDFTLRKLGGGEISLKDLKGKIVILNFFATY
jgi:cytochrome oxidase Cu insertion factor (SCO1/SenC/PrrC family)